MDTPGWVADSVFYEIFPDRFARSERVRKDGLNLEIWESPPTVHGFKGGDLYGVLEHLDYLQDLGVNALYLTPVFAAASNHRYHTYDYLKVDPLLGGNQALRDLLDAAHSRGMRVVLDGVFNHAGRGFWQFHHTLENGQASPYIDWFHFDEDRLAERRHWGAYPSPAETEAILHEGSLRAIGYQGWWDLPALPKFNTDTPAVREFLFSVAEHWLRFGVDGWRLDVPAEIKDDSFWQEFRRRSRLVNPEAYLVGEIWHDARRWLQGDQFDASMNYPVTAACMGFLPGPHLDLDLALKAGGFKDQLFPMDARAFAERIDWCQRLYEPEINRIQLNPLDSHDTPRFLSIARGDLASLRLALTFLFTYAGAPCIFYGDEIGLSGGHDPDCRQPFPWAQSSWNHEILGLTRGLIHLRRARRELRWGDFGTLHAEAGVFAFKRSLEDAHTVTALNASSEDQTIKLDLGPLDVARLEVLSGAAELLSGSAPELRIPRRSAVVLGFGAPQA